MTDRFLVEGAAWQVLRVGDRRYPCARFRKIVVHHPAPVVKIREALVPMENGWSALVDWSTHSFSSNYHCHGEDFDEEPTAVQILIGEAFDDDAVVLFLPYMGVDEAIEALDAVSRWSTGLVGYLPGTHEA